MYSQLKKPLTLVLLEQFETALSELFGEHCLSSLSCSTASPGTSPLLASGTFTNNTPPFTTLDRLPLYSMNHLKLRALTKQR